MDHRYDFLVIGSGIAGLFYALKVSELAPKAKIALVTKNAETATNTNRAQGGIAAVLSETDSFQAHIADTIRVGCGLCRPEVVEQIVEFGPKAVEELIAYGVQFTKTGDRFDLGREGGHSANRVAHASDLTGAEIERALLAACRSKSDTIHIYRDHMVLDLMKYDSGGTRCCAGAFVFEERHRVFSAFYTPVTMLATGGLGQVYFHTSNPEIATGDGVAIAWRAGIPIANLEFIQFHPTTLYAPGREPFLISEAVRGEGGRLRSVDGRFIMETAHELKDLAPRDVVARVIDKELKASGEEYVYLDVSHLDAEFIKNRFPNIYQQCLAHGFDITKRPVPVVPAAHYACGGVMSSVAGETALPGLYVAGEVAMTGLHGANRLASNSLLEAVVMAAQASQESVAYYRNIHFPEHVPVENSLYSSLSYPREKILIAHDRRVLRRIMSDFVGIVRTEDRLSLALEKVMQIRHAIEQYYFATPATYNILELRNLATVAELIIRSALWRRESRGLHYLDDRPGTNDFYKRDTIVTGQQEKGPGV
ncbi:L-aspartate oxidase [candidate division GN15 bacterium]|uniref:L-aspartate oxidase n=1 Tax=candidate division GN15 bacterium TaxID=2072418 RepID=A0A855X4Q3_9BACT|nr:MAG: L-aspartate oxidase [candidate division GN15 bacterium]